MTQHAPDTILRRVQPETFKTISLHHVESAPDLSWKAVGLLTYMLTRPPGWHFYRGDMVKRHSDGRDAVKSGLRELRDAGYVRMKPSPAGGWLWWVSDQPLTETAWTLAMDPKAENPPTENPEGGKSVPITRSTSQQLERTDTSGADAPDLFDGADQDTRADDFEKLWQLGRRRGSRKQAWEQYRKKVPKAVSASVVYAALDTLVANTEPRFVPHLFRWLRDERWTETIPVSGPGEGEPLEPGSVEWMKAEEERIRGLG